MASSSPPVTNNATPNRASAPITTTILPSINSSGDFRGLVKPKCIKCGNNARSRSLILIALVLCSCVDMLRVYMCLGVILVYETLDLCFWGVVICCCGGNCFQSVINPRVFQFRKYDYSFNVWIKLLGVRYRRVGEMKHIHCLVLWLRFVCSYNWSRNMNRLGWEETGYWKGNCIGFLVANMSNYVLQAIVSRDMRCNLN